MISCTKRSRCSMLACGVRGLIGRAVVFPCMGRVKTFCSAFFSLGVLAKEYKPCLSGLEGAIPELDGALAKVLFSYDALTVDLAEEARVVFTAFCDGLKHATTKDLRAFAMRQTHS